MKCIILLHVDGCRSLTRGKPKSEVRCLEPVTKDTHLYLSTKLLKYDSSVKSWQQYKLRLTSSVMSCITKCQCLWKNMYHSRILEEGINHGEHGNQYTVSAAKGHGS